MFVTYPHARLRMALESGVAKKHAAAAGRGRRLKRVEGHLPIERGRLQSERQIHAVGVGERERARGGEECNERGRSWKAREERERSAL